MNLVKSLAFVASVSLVASAIVACGAPNGQDDVGRGAQALNSPDAEPTTFMCGTDPTPCDRTTQYCEENIGGRRGRVTFQCANFPPVCVAAGELDCTCFEHGPTGRSCSALPSGGTFVTQRVP